jgi:hypothetical protein
MRTIAATLLLLSGCHERNIQADLAACTAFCKEAVVLIQWDENGIAACECQRIDSCDP